MTQHNALNLILCNPQLNKLKLGTKNGTEVTLKILSNIVDDCNDENKFPHTLLVTNTQVSKLRKAFVNGSSANMKLSKSQLHKIEKSGGFLGRLLGLLLKTGLPLTEIVVKPLAKRVLIPLELTAAESVTQMQLFIKKMFGPGTPTLIITDKEMNDVMKIVESLKKSGLLIRGVCETIRNEAKEQKGRLHSMLLGTLGARLLGNLLTGKGTIRAG